MIAKIRIDRHSQREKEIPKQDRLAQIDEKIQRLKSQKQAILLRDRKKKRAERTHRLIQYGALSEKYFEFTGSPEEFEALLKMVVAGKEWRLYRSSLNNDEKLKVDLT